MIRGIAQACSEHMEQRIEEGCPNGCGALIKLSVPIARLYLIPTELIELGEEHIEGFTTTDEESFGYIHAICQKCGYCICSYTDDSYTFEYAPHMEGI